MGPEESARGTSTSHPIGDSDGQERDCLDQLERGDEKVRPDGGPENARQVRKCEGETVERASGVLDASEPEEPIPLAMLNAFTYCPRRFHYEFVQGVMQDNAHVVHGRRVHARVDDPSLAERPRAEGQVIHTRSVWLTSLELGITGKIDVVEEVAGQICPVEYKKSRPPSRAQCPAGYWPNDGVQLCAQGLLLESHGGPAVERGYLYFAATRQRVEVPFTGELREQTLRAIAEAKAVARQDEEPAPLVDSPKCPACSLVALCMPDETNRLREVEAGEGIPVEVDARRDSRTSRADARTSSTGKMPVPQAAFPIPGEPLRCLIPAEYDTEILYVTQQGATVGKSGNAFVVRDREGNRLAEVPGAKLRQICVCGFGNITTQAIHACMDTGIDISFFSTGGRLKGYLAPLPNANGLLRSTVARALQSEAARLSIARQAIVSKIHNQRVMLMRNTRPDAKGAAFEVDIEQLSQLIQGAANAPTRQALLGIEGSAARLYFARFNGMLRPDVHAWFGFENRNRRPPRDPINALLSLAYSCLCKDVLSAVAAVGLDPYLGALHESRRGQPALALDLMEEFRPIIADSVALTLVNNGMLSKEDFVIGRQSCNLTDRGRRTFFAAYENRKSDECTHPVFQYKTSYLRLIEMQARVLARFLTGQIASYVGFRTR